jgi:hypothetical protein
MKAFIIILVLGVGGYFGYTQYINPSDIVKVTGNIQVSQRSNFNINAPQVSGSLYDATVHGTAQNMTSKPLKNVIIKYKIAGKNSSAMVFDLAPGQMVEFTTSAIKTKGKNPPYNLEQVHTEEMN